MHLFVVIAFSSYNFRNFFLGKVIVTIFSSITENHIPSLIKTQTHTFEGTVFDKHCSNFTVYLVS